MNGTITYVSPLTPSKQARGDDYYLVIFDLGNNKTGKTYLCPGYKNFPRWKPLMVAGTKVKNLIEKKSGVIDADSAIAAQ